MTHPMSDWESYLVTVRALTALAFNFFRVMVCVCVFFCQTCFLHVLTPGSHSWPLYICHFVPRHLSYLAEEMRSPCLCTNTELSYSISQHSSIRILPSRKRVGFHFFKLFYYHVNELSSERNSKQTCKFIQPS